MWSGVPWAQRWSFLHLMDLDVYPQRDGEAFELFDQMYMILLDCFILPLL